MSLNCVKRVASCVCVFVFVRGTSGNYHLVMKAGNRWSSSLVSGSCLNVYYVCVTSTVNTYIISICCARCRSTLIIWPIMPPVSFTNDKTNLIFYLR